MAHPPPTPPAPSPPPLPPLPPTSDQSPGATTPSCPGRLPGQLRREHPPLDAPPSCPGVSDRATEVLGWSPTSPSPAWGLGKRVLGPGSSSCCCFTWMTKPSPTRPPTAAQNRRGLSGRGAAPDPSGLGCGPQGLAPAPGLSCEGPPFPLRHTRPRLTYLLHCPELVSITPSSIQRVYGAPITS